jgi:hypothetical protein
VKRVRQRSSRRCEQCGSRSQDAWLCSRCTSELRCLLIGSGQKPVLSTSHDKAQPGIVWYIQRLEESAYRQTVLAKSLGVRSTSAGYALLVDTRATKLLARIGSTLAVWCDTAERLSGHERPLLGMDTTGSHPEALSVRRARFIATKVGPLCTQNKDVARLYGMLLGYAKDSWRIINRPADNCCGGCPTILVIDKAEEECSTILYAEDNAKTVTCPRCHVLHSVPDLRRALRNMVRDYVFPGPELLVLMETRLNDRMPRSTFYDLLRDGRLKPRSERQDGTLLFTYDDVCEAREKDKPTRRVKDVKSVAGQ